MKEKEHGRPKDRKYQEEYWMLEALAEAQKAFAENEVPIGCVVVRNNEIIARAHNRKEQQQSVLAHAEILAIAQACKTMNSWRLDEADIYVTLEPCAMCASAIQQARFRKLYFAAPEPKTGAVVSIANSLDQDHLNHRVVWESGLLQDQSSRLLKDFFRKKRIRNKELNAQLGGRAARKDFMEENGPMIKTETGGTDT